MLFRVLYLFIPLLAGLITALGSVWFGGRFLVHLFGGQVKPLGRVGHAFREVFLAVAVLGILVIGAIVLFAVVCQKTVGCQ